MTVRKKDNLLRGDRTPAYVSRETAAAELQISPATWDQWVKEGRLPKACEAFPAGTLRWRWEDIDRRLCDTMPTSIGNARNRPTAKRARATLPEGVEKTSVKRGDKTYTYYYWNPGRGTDREGDRIKLPNAEKNPAAFWTEVERRQSSAPTAFPPGSVGDLITRYRKSDEFTRNAEGTQSNYEVTMRRMEEQGLAMVKDVTPLVVQTARDATKDTPVMANQMLSVGRTIWDWAIPLGLAETNPFDKVKDFDIPDRGHVPWPAWTIDFVRAHAWPDLVRMERLGIMTCQRGSDMVRMGPEHRDRNGIWCRPKKTRKRRRSFHIPLATPDAFEIDRWAETPMLFTNSRWMKPIERFREDLYLYSPKGAQYTPDGLRARWGRWLADTTQGRELCRRWKEWVTGQVKKYEWDIDPEDADHPTIHGLRGTGILARAEQGYEVDQIANDIGMSRQNVEHYMRFKDQMKVGADGQKRLRSGPAETALESATPVPL